MTTKPFNIEEAKAGARVVTDRGESARIICYDAKFNCPIIALITQYDNVNNEDYEVFDTFREDGTNIHTSWSRELRIWVSDEDSVDDLTTNLHKYVRREFTEYYNSISKHAEDEVNLYVTRFIEEMTKQINKIEALRKQ